MKSMTELCELISNHDIIFWNGTLGVVEDDKYINGSDMLVKFLLKKLITKIRKTENNIGGGDTGGFVNKYKHNFMYRLVEELLLNIL